jgi:hypothetical protein
LLDPWTGADPTERTGRGAALGAPRSSGDGVPAGDIFMTAPGFDAAIAAIARGFVNGMTLGGA